MTNQSEEQGTKEKKEIDLDLVIGVSTEDSVPKDGKPQIEAVIQENTKKKTFSDKFKETINGYYDCFKEITNKPTDRIKGIINEYYINLRERIRKTQIPRDIIRKTKIVRKYVLIGSLITTILGFSGITSYYFLEWLEEIDRTAIKQRAYFAQLREQHDELEKRFKVLADTNHNRVLEPEEVGEARHALGEDTPYVLDQNIHTGPNQRLEKAMAASTFEEEVEKLQRGIDYYEKKLR